jgi:hypothetical protein
MMLATATRPSNVEYLEKIRGLLTSTRDVDVDAGLKAVQDSIDDKPATSENSASPLDVYNAVRRPLVAMACGKLIDTSHVHERRAVKILAYLFNNGVLAPSDDPELLLDLNLSRLIIRRCVETHLPGIALGDRVAHVTHTLVVVNEIASCIIDSSESTTTTTTSSTAAPATSSASRLLMTRAHAKDMTCLLEKMLKYPCIYSAMNNQQLFMTARVMAGHEQPRWCVQHVPSQLEARQRRQGRLHEDVHCVCRQRAVPATG